MTSRQRNCYTCFSLSVVGVSIYRLVHNRTVYLFSISVVGISAPVEPRIRRRAWAYSSSRCFRLFIDDLPPFRAPLLPLTSLLLSRLPSPIPCEDRLLGVLQNKFNSVKSQALVCVCVCVCVCARVFKKEGVENSSV